MPREVLEVSVFWGGELFAVEYFDPRERVTLDALGVPDADGIVVMTKRVEAAPRMRRNRVDLPYAAVALAAAFVHAGVVVSIAQGPKPVAPSSMTTAFVEARGGGYVARADLVGAFPSQVSSARFEPAETLGEEDDPIAAREDMASFGMVGLLAQYRGDGEGAVAWASAANESHGNLWGDAIADTRGIGGLDLSGVGEGGGGKALGSTVLDHVDVPHPMGSGCYAQGHLIGSHVSQTIICRLASPSIVSTRIPAETIQRVVRASEGRFRGCYVEGLARNSKLEGRVVTKFVIARDGSVAATSDDGSDLADASVIACVGRTFANLEFPESPAGIVTVVYPIDLHVD